MLLLNGKEASASIKQQLKAEIKQLIAAGNRAPHLAAILVGNNAASETYVASKVKSCKEIGFESTLIRLDSSATEEELLNTIFGLNADENIDGILVQLPLPGHINEEKVIYAIHATKDVDGFHPENMGKLVQGMASFIPATPYGIMLLLEHYNIKTKGMHAVIVGRSNIVGRPMSVLLSSNGKYGNCTVTVCHSQTKDLNYFTRQADLIVAALGKPEFVKADMIKQGAVVIDVGISRIEDANAPKGYRIVGDVAFDEVAPLASAITPVPGGVGLMTIAGLLKNTLQAYKQRVGIRDEVPA